LIEAAGTVADYPDADVVVVFDRTEVDVEESGLSHVVQHTLTKILTERGACDQAMQRFDYDPASQAIEVRRVAVHRAGGTVENVDLAALADVTAPAHAIYWGARMLALGLPRLEVGDAVELETYRKGFQIAYLGDPPGSVGANGGGGAAGGAAADESKYIPPMEGHFYDVVLFQGSSPQKEKTYTLHTPRDKPVQYSVYNGEVYAAATFDDTRYTYRFWLADQPAAPREWRSPGLSDYVPKVVMATVQDWGEKSRWFFTVNDNQFAATPAIQAKVNEITHGLKDEDRIISAINHWVAQEIRYCGLSMGKGEGYTLHPGDMIFNERSGVCKDIAGMTITMLRAAGFEVYPAMTMAGARVERIPADQFNHCVAALRRADGSFEMLDPTWIPFAMADWSRAEGEQNYVIGTPEGQDLTETRPFTAAENRTRLTVRGTIDANGTLNGELTLVGEGYADTRLRRSIGFAPKMRHAAQLEAWLAALDPAAELTGMELGDHRDVSRPFPITLRFRLPGYAAVGARTLHWQPLAPRLLMANYGGAFRFIAPDLPDERSTPALIWYAQQVDIDEEIRLPKGFTAAAPERAWTTGAAGDVAHCRFDCDAGQRKFAIAGSVAVESRTILPAEWPAFAAAVGMIEDFGATRLVARRKGA
jgi:transglutaminase-like putative cysteine protease